MKILAFYCNKYQFNCYSVSEKLNFISIKIVNRIQNPCFITYNKHFILALILLLEFSKNPSRVRGVVQVPGPGSSQSTMHFWRTRPGLGQAQVCCCSDHGPRMHPGCIFVFQGQARQAESVESRKFF